MTQNNKPSLPFRVVRALLLLTLLGLSTRALADGQPPRGADPGAAPAGAGGDGWQQVNGGMMVQPGESIPARNLVAGAYGFIWLMVCGFVYSVWRRTQAVEKEVHALRERIERASAESAAGR